MDIEKEELRCTDCRYCLGQDNGYSNFTVEGTEYECLLGMGVEFPVDEWGDGGLKLESAENCNKFSEGNYVWVDVERGDGDLENYSQDPEIKELLKKSQLG